MAWRHLHSTERTAPIHFEVDVAIPDRFREREDVLSPGRGTIRVTGSENARIDRRWSVIVVAVALVTLTEHSLRVSPGGVEEERIHGIRRQRGKRAELRLHQNQADAETRVGGEDV